MFGTRANRLNVPSVAAPIRRLIALIVTNAEGVISLAILPRIVKMRGVLPPPPAGGPPPVPPAPQRAALAPQFPQLPRPPASPAPPGPPPPVSEPVHVPVPLMSLDVPAPPSIADVDFPDASEEASHGESSPELFEDSQIPFPSQPDSIGDFSEEDPAPSSSPSISSFSSLPGSESILKNLPIVSSDPKVVEQIVVVDSGSSNINSLNSSENSTENNSEKGNNYSIDDILSADPVVNVVNPPSKIPKLGSKVGSKVPSGPKASGAPKQAGKGRGPKGSKGLSTVSSDSESEFKRPLPVSGGAVPECPVHGSNRSRSPLSPAGSHRLPSIVGSRPGRSTSR